MKRLLCFFICALAFASCTTQSSDSNTTTDDSAAVEHVIMARRSIRQYTSQTISRDTLDQILKSGINAPNGMGRQAYEIRVVNNRELLHHISEAVLKDNPGMNLKPGTDNIFAGAPCVIFIANDTSYDMSQVDCGLLGENIILSAWAKGIGSCCMAHPVRLMKESESCQPLISQLGFTTGYNLLYSIVLGYPNETPEAKPRKDDMIRFIK